MAERDRDRGVRITRRSRSSIWCAPSSPRYGAVVASVFVRASSGSGRLDLAPELVRLLKDLARTTERDEARRSSTCFFGNPYTASFVPELPAMLLTYDFYDQPERAAVRALAGEAAIGGQAADHPVAAVPRRPRPRPARCSD